ncbi:hypothetical protein N8J89_23680 [Crossiella sp. CA-258035]|uniref:hypothetical protein n=1 Tax=Crossiella sp. CA-258035 TaxID=2981138 RepID=UPI0024BCBE2F|nr:hypothetical protein [Crossiella sp. CA-258035]WHT16132.1 hypothetical protein N8J89_23680 [Crossiella sp. CA-258035]
MEHNDAVLAGLDPAPRDELGDCVVHAEQRMLTVVAAVTAIAVTSLCPVLELGNASTS